LRFIFIDFLGLWDWLSFGGAVLLCFLVLLGRFVVGAQLVWTDEFSLVRGGIRIAVVDFVLGRSAHF
jgi:hypothetical protein